MAVIYAEKKIIHPGVNSPLPVVPATFVLLLFERITVIHLVTAGSQHHNGMLHLPLFEDIFKILLTGARHIVRGLKLPLRERLPALRS